MQRQHKSRSREGILKRHSSEIKMGSAIAIAIFAQVLCERALGCSGPAQDHGSRSDGTTNASIRR